MEARERAVSRPVLAKFFSSTLFIQTSRENTVPGFSFVQHTGLKIEFRGQRPFGKVTPMGLVILSSPPQEVLGGSCRLLRDQGL
jgi:hypothetical protein